MEMHTLRSLYDIHGISTERRRAQSRPFVRFVVGRIAALLTKMKRAIERELAIRHAMTELAEMDERMLRDMGIHRSEIENLLRRPRANVGAMLRRF